MPHAKPRAKADVVVKRRLRGAIRMACSSKV
jgi:hypothetical protein